jgi:cytosine/adenosine deaminase-related metal-dependent hydrolase
VKGVGEIGLVPRGAVAAALHELDGGGAHLPMRAACATLRVGGAAIRLHDRQTPGSSARTTTFYSMRGMPAPLRPPRNFLDILELIWWRLDTALDLEMLRWSAMLGALEALECGTTAIVDHHESPNAIEGSLSVIADACAEVGVRVSCAYGVTDRHGPDGAKQGLAENERFLRAGGRGMVGVHAAFTCADDTLEAAAGLARDLGVGLHIHVAEGEVDRPAGARLEPLARETG